MVFFVICNYENDSIQNDRVNVLTPLSPLKAYGDFSKTLKGHTESPNVTAAGKKKWPEGDSNPGSQAYHASTQSLSYWVNQLHFPPA